VITYIIFLLYCLYVALQTLVFDHVRLSIWASLDAGSEWWCTVLSQVAGVLVCWELVELQFNVYRVLLIIKNNNLDPFLHQWWKPLLIAVAFTTLYAQLAIIMSLPSHTPGEAKVNWSDNETMTLVEYCWEHRSETGDGGSFKPQTFHAAAQHIASKHTSATPKTLKQVIGKWWSVSTTNNSGLLAYTSMCWVQHMSSYPITIHTQVLHMHLLHIYTKSTRIRLDQNVHSLY
jgi:hypothetical protein